MKDLAIGLSISFILAYAIFGDGPIGYGAIAIALTMLWIKIDEEEK